MYKLDTQDIFKIDNKGTISFTVLVKPSANKNELIIKEGELIIRIKAARTKGKANKELIKFLAKILQVPSSEIRIVQGATSTIKRIEIYNHSINYLIDYLKASD